MGLQTVVVCPLWEIFDLPRSENNDEHLRILGLAIRRVRERQGMSVDELAQASGIHRLRLQALEKGHLDPTYELLLALADGLRVQPSELILAVEEAEEEG
jgi:transcriptional regulator with XRE-family HTH domain